MIASLLAELVFISTIQQLQGDEDAAEQMAEAIVGAILARRPYVLYEDSPHAATVMRGWYLGSQFFPTRVVSSEHDKSFDALRRDLSRLVSGDDDAIECVITAALDLCLWDRDLPVIAEAPAHQLAESVLH